jgi:hypothetical protein
MSRACNTHGKKRNSCRVLVANSEGKRLLLRPRGWGRIILKWILENWIAKVYTAFIWLRIWVSGELV